MKEKLTDYLGACASNMLRDEPFSNWRFERSIENDLEEPIVQYVFPEHSMDLRCDGDEKIDVIFLSEERQGPQDGNLFEVPFTWSRDQVLSHFGPPAKSGPKVTDPILGNYGEWDRFVRQGYTVHFEYRTDRDEIRQITLSRKK